MIELVYPVEDFAPVIPARTYDDVNRELLDGEHGREPHPVEYFPIVDENGFVLAMSPRSYCRSGSKVLHPVVHLHILNRNGDLYLQKRSMKKKIQPGRWDTAVGGHVIYGESLMEALVRESSEELGFTEFNPIHLCTYVYESDIEKELVTVFVAVGRDFVLTPDHDELDDGRFWSLAEIDAHYGDGTLTPNFESEFSEIRKSLLSLL